MILRKGFVYRLGVRIKEFGERMNHVKVLGKRIFGCCSGLVIGLGIAIRDTVSSCYVRDM